MRLHSRRGLAELVQPGQSPPRQRSRQRGEKRRPHLEESLCPIRCGCAEMQLGFEVIARQRPGEQLARTNGPHEQRAAEAGLSKQLRRRRRVDDPPGSRRQAAPVRFDRRDTGPPVGEVPRFGEELPDVFGRCEQLARCGSTGHARSVRLSQGCQMPNRCRAGLAVAARGTRSHGEAPARPRLRRRSQRSLRA